MRVRADVRLIKLGENTMGTFGIYGWTVDAGYGISDSMMQKKPTQEEIDAVLPLVNYRTLN